MITINSSLDNKKPVIITGFFHCGVIKTRETVREIFKTEG